MKQPAPPMSSRLVPGDQRGFTLLEAVFAMIILAIGLLGLAGMQTMAMTRNVDAAQLGRATNLAAGMIERVHYNRQNVTDYNGALGTGIDTSNAATIPPTTQPTARGDYQQWLADLTNSGLDLPVGTVVVTSPFGPAALNQSQVVLTLAWTTKKMGGGGVAGAEAQTVARRATITFQTVVTPP